MTIPESRLEKDRTPRPVSALEANVGAIPKAADAANAEQIADGRDIDDPGFSLIAVATVLLRWIRLMMLIPLALSVVTVALLVTRPPSYTATASFMPQHTGGSSRLGNIAQQLGVAAASGTQGQSPAFYAELVTSRAILLPTLETTYTYSSGGGEVRATLIDILEIEGRDLAERREAGLRRLRDNVRVGTSALTDIVRISVTSVSPALAESIAARILELVNQFNLETRQSQATEERRFVEERMGEARRELSAAEDERQLFLERNRGDLRQSPELTIAHDRLQREVLMRQQVYSALAQSYEEARIEEVRNLPVVTIIDPPTRPVRRDGRGLLVGGVLAIVAGLIVASGLAFVLDPLRPERRKGRDFQEFERLRRTVIQDVRQSFGLSRHKHTVE